jgi:Carboxypeptidase regulatory-like domain
VLPGVTVTVVANQTKLTRTQSTNDSGSYLFVNLPIGSYTVTFAHDGFQTENIPSIAVQADRTMTVNSSMRVGGVESTITVNETPLVNSFDTTNGYVLDKEQFETVPLPTGSFTGVAILSPGVNAELPNGSGANAGLGNQSIWANGAARHKQYVSPERRRCKQSFQWQEHQHGSFGTHCEQHRRCRRE